MKYTSRKDNTITAELVKQNAATVILKYLTGPEVDKTITISLGTLKRWWSPVTDEDSSESVLGIDSEKVNEPYAPNVTPHYIEKPQSVIDYEKKAHSKRTNDDIPGFEQVVNDLGSVSKKVSEKSEYLTLSDGLSTVWRKKSCIDAYVVDNVWQACSEAGLNSTANKDTKRPFAIKVTTSEQYEKFVNAVKAVFSADAKEEE